MKTTIKLWNEETKKYDDTEINYKCNRIEVKAMDDEQIFYFEKIYPKIENSLTPSYFNHLLRKGKATHVLNQLYGIQGSKTLETPKDTKQVLQECDKEIEEIDKLLKKIDELKKR